MTITAYLTGLSARMKALAGIATALVTIAGAWTFFGFPVPASSQDIRRLDRQQAEIAIEVYQQAARDALLALTDQKIRDNDTARTIVEQDLERFRAQLGAARSRVIELSK